MPKTVAPKTPYVTQLEAMTPKQLLTEYNRVSPTKRRMVFRSTAEAINRITVLQAPAPVPAAAAKKTKAKKPAKAVKAKVEPKNVRARMADVVIRIMTEGGANPRREGSAAHAHFEKMKGGITVRDYLAKFDPADQRTARQWLWNTIQDGHVKTLGA